MPPWLTDPEGVAAFVAALLALLVTIAGGLLAAIAAIVAVWRAKVKPLLTDTSKAARTAADQLTPNHGSSARDSLGRIENTLDRLDRSMSRQIGEIRADMNRTTQHNDRQHSEIFRRLHALETPMEDTRP
ncbi:hypothetical protein [Brachybacterium massiliense]|uniref:hypothetical protein n=1 Tax=Brachybacterium massiliense TaxID=1755098 RepID=UPI000B3BC46B|nr:hypothetical protein [Brachybacterium massiliense]